MQLLLILPWLAFLSFLILDLSSQVRSSAEEQADVRLAFLRASVLWGGLVVLFSEALSPFHLLTRPGLAAAWGLTTVASVAWAWRTGAIRTVREWWRAHPVRWAAADGMLLIGLGTIATLLLVVAWIAPPSTADSLLYHMARVLHWADAGSLEHYPVSYAHQLIKPTWAETAILTLRVLWGNDRPANLVQWFSMAGSLLLVSWIAARMGASRRGQILAALFALSVPMGILQATSTQNDYVVAYWAACLLGLVVLGKQRPLRRHEVVLLAVTLGVGTLTKGTFFVYALPVMAWHFVPMVFRRRPTQWIAEGLIVLGIACLLNLGFWARNVVTYGGPYGTMEWLQRNLTPLQGAHAPLDSQAGLTVESAGTPTPAPGAKAVLAKGTGAQPEGPEVPAVFRRWAMLLAYNLVTPSSALNGAIVGFLQKAPALFDEPFFKSLAEIAWNHEDTAGNPLHLVLVLGSLVLLIPPLAAGRPPGRWQLAAVVLATYALIPLVIGHGAGIWGLRYQLPFFILWAPVFGLAIDRLGRGALGVVGGLGLLAVALPWVLFNNTRPVIGLPPWPTRTESVFRATRTDLLFATFAGADAGKSEAFLSAAEAIRARGCTQVGLRINSSDYDYLYWWSLGAPESGVHIENVYPLPETRRYSDPDFRPCAILCTICGDRQRLHGLEMVSEWEGIRVFAGSTFVSDEDG